MKRLELTGNRIGSIEVEKLAWIDKSGRSWWKCRCDCGYEYYASSGTLRNSRSCKRCASRKEIPSGTRFGKLTVLRHCYDSKDRQAYECQCDCGNHKIYTAAQLRKGNTKTCGKCKLNRFEKNGDEAFGYTRNGEKFRFSSDVWDIVTQRNWRKTEKGYIVSGRSKSLCFLHRLVVGASEDVLVDHINRDKADCRRENLRLATNSQNGANAPAYRSNKSTGHKNVYRNSGLFRVTIRKNGKMHHFGYYKTLNEAVRVANSKRVELFGEFAYYDPLIDGALEHQAVNHI